MLPLWTPRVTAGVTAGHGRSSILRGVPGKAASGKESASHLSRPRQGHTWTPQAVGPGQHLAPASLGRLPTHCGGRQLGWSPAQLCGRKPFAWGRGPCGPTQVGGVNWPKDKLRNLVWLYPSLLFVFFHLSHRPLNLCPCICNENTVTELYLQPRK